MLKKPDYEQLEKDTYMATSQEKIVEKHPKATTKRYKTAGGSAYYLVWSEGAERGIRLGEGRTASSAWVHAALRMDY